MVLTCIPTRVFAEAEDEVAQWVPLIREACDQLDDCPDFTLVEVTSYDEHVRIRKEGRELVIDVVDDCERVHVQVPFGIARAVARKLVSCERRNGHQSI